MSGPVTCPKCGGMGYVLIDDGHSTAKCNLCHERGMVLSETAKAYIAERRWAVRA